MDFDPNEPTDMEAMIILQGFLILQPRIAIEIAFPVIRDYVIQAIEFEGPERLELMSQLACFVRDACIESKADRVTH